jgi:hypothetical protein
MPVPAPTVQFAMQPPMNTASADASTLVDIGVLDPQPEPPPQLAPAVEMSTVLPLA